MKDKLLLLFLIVLFPISLFADPVRGRLLWTDPDGSPNLTPFYEITTASGTLADDGDGTATLSNTGTPEGTAVLSTGEGGGTKYLREDGDGTCSWQTPAGGGDLLADGTVPLTANWDVGAFTLTGTQFISDIAGGTAPFVVTSTTEVANLKAATATLATTATTANAGDSATDFFSSGEIADAQVSNTLTSSTCTGNAATVTTNANLTGEVTSTGNATTIADTITVTGWTMGASVATTPAANDADTSLATTAFCETTQDYLKTSEHIGANEVYDATGWDGDTSVPEKDDIRDKIETMVTAIGLNTAKNTNVSTALSAGTINATTYAITSDGGADDIVLPEADTTNAGLLGSDKWDEIVANSVHSADNTQAHSDYLLNSGADTIAGALTINPGTLFIQEQADASADVAGQGQIWINTATPNELWFTDDAGTDTQLAVAGAGDISDVWSVASGDVTNPVMAAGEGLDCGAGELELPQASPGSPDADGEVDLDMTDGTLVIQNSSGHTYLAASTDVVYGKLLHQKSITILEPDKVQAVIDNIPMMAVEADEFPHGIVIVQVYLKTDANSTLSVNLEKWATPADGSPDTLTTIATSTSAEVNEAPDTTGVVGTSEVIMLDLPTDDVNWLMLMIEYYEPIS